MAKGRSSRSECAVVYGTSIQPNFIGEQQTRFNELLRRLSPADRGSVAEMLELAFQGGVFETLKALEEAGIEPFQEGYEGSPHEDFIGRLNGWQWPSA